MQLLFCDSAFSFYMRKKVSDGFSGLHKNMNCAFPLTVDKLHKPSILLLTVNDYN